MCHLTKTMERLTAEAHLLAAAAEDHHDQLAQKDYINAEEDQEVRSVALAPKIKHNVKHSSSSSSSSSCNKSSSNSEDTSTVLTSEAGHAIMHDPNVNVASANANLNAATTPSGSSLTSSPQAADNHHHDHHTDHNLLPEMEINLNLDPESYNINPYSQNMQMLLAPDHHDLSLPFLNLAKGICTAPMEDSTFFPTPGFNFHDDQHSLPLSTSFIPQQQQLPTLDHFNTSAIHHGMEQPCFGDNFQHMNLAYDHLHYPNYNTNPHILHPSQMHGGGIFVNPYLAQGDEAANHMYPQNWLQQMSSSNGVASYNTMAADGSNMNMFPMYNSTSNMGGHFQPLINAMTSNCMETNAAMVEDDHFMIQAGGQLHPIDINTGLSHNAASLPINFVHGFPGGAPQDYHQETMMSVDQHHQHYTNNTVLINSNSATPNESIITAPLSALTMNEMESQRRSLILQQGGKDQATAESCSSGSDQDLEGAAVESASYGGQATVNAVKSISGSPPTRPNSLKRRSPDGDGEDEQDQREPGRRSPPLKRSSSWNCVATNNNINSSSNNTTNNQAHGLPANQATINGGLRGGSARLSSIQRSQSAQDMMMIPHNSKPARARQASASDPQSVAARHRRERISERLKILQQLVPNGSKVDLVTMLEKAINYVKFLQLQVKVLATDEYWPTPLNKFPKQLATFGLPPTIIDQSSPPKGKVDKPNGDKEEANQTN